MKKPPPPITFPRFHSETSPPFSFPPSPVGYLRTAVDTPQATQNLVLDTPMEHLVTTLVTKAPPAQAPAVRISVTTNPPHTLPAENALGLATQVEPPAQTIKRPTISDHLEEVANDRLVLDKNPTRIATDCYSLGPMPPIQDASPFSIFENIHISTIKEWEACPRGKLIAIPFDPNARNPDLHESLRAKILTAGAEIIAAQEISVAAPMPSEEAVKKNWTPTSFLIYNITEEQANTLLDRKVWSSKLITFHVTPFATTCPSFLFTIRDFTTTAMRDIFDMVKCYALGERPARLELGGYDFVVGHVVLEACASDPQ